MGLYTSPHILDFRERIRICHPERSEESVSLIPRQDVWNFVRQWQDTFDHVDMSFFEITTAMALQWFADQEVDYVVLETGLGGRLDSTNIVAPVLSVITNIGLDHCDLLGETLQEVAFEKAGIIKEEVPVVIGESAPESDEVFERVAKAHNALLVHADREWEIVDSAPSGEFMRYHLQRPRDGRNQILDLDLMGSYQRKNILTVRTAVSLLRHQTPLNISTRALVEGTRSVCSSTGLMGRWQRLGTSPQVICDTGHNAHGIKELVEQIARQDYRKLYLVVGMVSDKDFDSVIPLMPRDGYYIFTAPSVPRALPASSLAEKFLSEGFEGEVVEGVHAA